MDDEEEVIVRPTKPIQFPYGAWTDRTTQV